MAQPEGPKTRFLAHTNRLVQPSLVVLTGPRKGFELKLPALGTRVRIGSAPDCDLNLPDIGARHVELFIAVDGSGARVVDHSGGATSLNGIQIHEGILEPGGTLNLGGIEVRLKNESDPVSILPSTREIFGHARGRSLAMREIFGLCEAVAASDATMLFLGETGTGKDVLARSIHDASPRAGHPLVTIDCGAIAPTLIESELFGHERGAFTGAEESRPGAFERAHRGTLFLDEIGELPLDTQPKLLRAIDEREVQRLGGTHPSPVNVRILAATKRDLEEEVRRGRFREDLFFRLAVIPLRLPPLRERSEDIPLLVDFFTTRFAERTGHRANIDPRELSSLVAHDWPGNVRELRNTVERALWLAQTGDGTARFVLPSLNQIFGGDEAEPAAPVHDLFAADVPFSEQKQAWEQAFERHYLSWLMARSAGSLSKAARLASMDRKHLRTLLRKHELYRGPSQGTEELLEPEVAKDDA
ncbi:MAG: sigma 54-dependent Fis family transcriptional regulator [Deltaproteobacteria bacterium]|nr:sigma 54-dependent Fis family transcriptional regulator [Deltaproteobacteria bacterium]